MSMMLGRRSLVVASALFAAVGPVRAMAAGGLVITGAGSSFVSMLMKRWMEEAPKAIGATITYNPVGSGNGRNKVLAREVDFGVSGEPIPADKLAAAHLVQFPMAFGGVTCVVNLPGIATNQLQLTGEILAGIYSGGIRKWNDPRIVALNAGLKLPDLDIRPLTQATPNGALSGTTFVFTQYLLATNADWREKYGAVITRRWSVGSMVATAEFMVETLKALPGSIGYMPIGDAQRHGVMMVKLKNKAGKSVAASSESLAAAVAQVDWKATADLVPSTIDLPGDGAWPIVVATYALVPRIPTDQAHGEAVRAFFTHVVTQGATAAAAENAAALPAAVQPAVLALLGKPAS